MNYDYNGGISLLEGNDISFFTNKSPVKHMDIDTSLWEKIIHPEITQQKKLQRFFDSQNLCIPIPQVDISIFRKEAIGDDEEKEMSWYKTNFMREKLKKIDRKSVV